MISPSSFNEKDKEKLTEFLNFIAKKGKFEVDVEDTIKFFKLLSWAQQSLMMKISGNIISDIKEHKDIVPVKEPKKASKKKASK